MPASDYYDLVTLGAAKVDPDTGVPVTQAVSFAGDEETDVEDFGELDMYGSLGVAAVPGSASADGATEGIVLRNCGGGDALIACRDPRTATVVAELSPGETCLHSTGPGFDSRVFCKDQVCAIVVGDDTLITVDRGLKKITIAGFGHIFEVSEDNGIAMAESGGASITLKDGKVNISGGMVFIGRQPVVADTALVGAAGPAGLPSASVFISKL